MIWLFLLCVVLTAAVAVLSFRIIWMRKAADEIWAGLSEKLNCDTNTLISISTNDRAMRRLANNLNIQLQELRRQRRRYVQGDLELKNAIANISHDLRTPLTAISGYLDLLDHAEKEERVSRYLGIIRNRTEMLIQLTEELFDYSVITSPQYDFPTELISVNSVLEESILEFYAVLQERKITPVITMPETKVMIRLNKKALFRIFSNIINNAIKYSDGDLKITLTASGKILFSNTASGLSEVQVERLFDRFYTVENARKSTGLGLSIARTLTEQMGGTITARYENFELSICIFFSQNDC